MGTLQNNPSDPTEDFVQPDWNSANGEGVAPDRDDSVDPTELYEKQREGAKERQASRESGKKMAGDNTDDNK